MRTLSETLEDLRPRSKTNVMQLLRDAGHDVEYWKRNSDGSSVARPAANPNYCYNWSFGSAAEVIVLCVWHESIRVDRDRLVYGENMRSLDNELTTTALSSGRSSNDRDRARQQATRAREFDGLVRSAYERLTPVRLVINEGNKASREQLGSQSSEVSKRELDPAAWYVHEYSENTGEFLLVREVKPVRDIVDLVEGLGNVDEDGPEDQVQLRAIRVRRGQQDFRDRLLSAWTRRCVVTESRVESLLEAAHIVPHADGTNYRTSNGLLLRADVHTLFDVGLLSIDEWMRVHLAPPLMMSEYRQYHGKQIERRPDVGADAPSVDALRTRHKQFVASHGAGNR